jgi:hypothetical protein
MMTKLQRYLLVERVMWDLADAGDAEVALDAVRDATQPLWQALDGSDRRYLQERGQIRSPSELDPDGRAWIPLEFESSPRPRLIESIAAKTEYAFTLDADLGKGDAGPSAGGFAISGATLYRALFPHDRSLGIGAGHLVNSDAVAMLVGFGRPAGHGVTPTSSEATINPFIRLTYGGH